MPTYVIKVTATVVVHNIEAASPEEAQQLIVADLAGRFPAHTDILAEATVSEDVSGLY